ncbi:hypothetical protein J4573_50450 [Actinomadura barringtoniae]|uniref:Aminoglycoside phosphotransferase n=1 Tax=Actinomadura barringtoniae TaxID=1427535 RepID=A0A939TDA0_9ACTN|nr:hypothetical protein [Actinomadura barringtoniae]MBO2455377.1 hypothetical protein [Actinomadura barringtoniae]
MAVERIRWEDLPERTRRQVETETGTVYAAETVSEGLNSAIAAILRTESGRVFVKGLHRDYPRRWTQDREAAINSSIGHISPRLLWRVEGEWDLLGFEAIDGRHADYRPGSTDLPLLISTMAELGKTTCPDVEIKVAEDRWRPYVSNLAHLAHFAGDRLLHTDYNPVNILIADGRALLIDWAWPTKGAAWIDPACLITRLMASGHTAAQAEGAVRDLPAWREAPVDGLHRFAEANARVWAEIATNDSSEWTHSMNTAAREWLKHRATL